MRLPIIILAFGSSGAGLPGLAFADAREDARALMREAAIEKAEVVPPRDVGQGSHTTRSPRRRGAAEQAARDTAIEAAVDELHGREAAPANGRGAPARRAAAASSAADSNQRGASAAAHAHSVDNGHPGNPHGNGQGGGRH